ncbi:MAG: phosphoribosylamine--glycine ligase [Methanobacteriota archaeon]|jgi:phosphoribosylamine--glycine ligase|nr:MAG: phosphoribosylamine--glycine ligase [Euryarchaeota archaeon]
MSGAIVLVVGGGGREHALAIGLAASPSVAEVHVVPGNAGTASMATNHSLPDSDVKGLVELAEQLDCDLVVVGPEGPLVAGLADMLRTKGIPCFGPHSAGAELEGSKLHAKQVMQQNGVPTGGVQIIDDATQIEAALDSFQPPWVVKRDVLAGGKGVTVTDDRDVAREAIASAIDSDSFVLLEEFLSGEEASMLVLLDESGWVALPASQDHKRVGEGDTGPNTGGMGAYAPAPVVTDAVRDKVFERIVEPMHGWLSAQETPYRGCLYVGLMIDEDDDPYVVEYNVRFGDPETQVTIPLISSDLYQLLLAVAEGRVADTTPEFSDSHALTVVLASQGYPGPPRTGLPISLASEVLVDAGSSALVHHAGTGHDEQGRLVASGGRVLASTGIGSSLEEARDAAYDLLAGIELEGSHYRRDIGHRAL